MSDIEQKKRLASLFKATTNLAIIFLLRLSRSSIKIIQHYIQHAWIVYIFLNGFDFQG